MNRTLISLGIIVALAPALPAAGQKGACKDPGVSVAVATQLSNGIDTTLTTDGRGDYVDGQDGVSAAFGTCSGSTTLGVDFRQGSAGFNKMLRWMLAAVAYNPPADPTPFDAKVFGLYVYGLGDPSLLPASTTSCTAPYAADERWVRLYTKIWFIEPSVPGNAAFIQGYRPGSAPGTPGEQASPILACRTGNTWVVQSDPSTYEYARFRWQNRSGYTAIVDQSGNIIPESVPFKLTVSCTTSNCPR